MSSHGPLLQPARPAAEPRLLRDYRRMAAAISYLVDNWQRQPSLAEIAQHVHLSPQHFQRVFARWAGLSPKRFLQALTLEQGKARLSKSGSLLALSEELGLSSASRLYDHFVHLEALTPGEYRAAGADVVIDYGVQASPFGWVFVAATARGICKLSFLDRPGAGEAELRQLKDQWHGARFNHDGDKTAAWCRGIFTQHTSRPEPLSLHVKGSNFQIQVWRSLLALAPGQGLSYGQLARQLQRPGAARAVGSAVAANPVALLIPCHRVIRQSGALGEYRWGSERKRVLQFYEWLQAQGKKASA